jgi:hypothetical protein
MGTRQGGERINCCTSQGKGMLLDLDNLGLKTQPIDNFGEGMLTGDCISNAYTDNELLIFGLHTEC